MVRNTFLISFAVLIDLLQATISAGLFVIGAFPGTAAGAVAGCALGSYVSGIGCTIVGAVGAVVGSFGNIAAPATLSFAIGLGIGVNFCLDIVLGGVLIFLLTSQGMFYSKYSVTGLIVEMVPGLNDLPGWTLMVVLSVIRKKAEEGKLKGAVGGAFTKLITTGVAGMGATAVFGINQMTQKIARDRGIYTPQEQNDEREETKQYVAADLKNIDGIRAPKTQPTYAA